MNENKLNNLIKDNLEEKTEIRKKRKFYGNKRKEIEKNKVKEILEDYNNRTTSIKELCSKHMISTTTLYRLIKENNNNKRRNTDTSTNFKKIFSGDEKTVRNKLVDLIQGGDNNFEVNSNKNNTYEKLYNELKKDNLELKNEIKALIKMNEMLLSKYSVNKPEEKTFDITEIKSDDSEDTEDDYSSDEEILIKKPEKIKASKLPFCYERNMDILKDIECFLDNTKDRVQNYNLKEIEYYNKLYDCFNEICDDIDDIDNGLKTKRQISNPFYKIKSIRNLYEKNKKFF